jgi:hypothetical protein
VGFRHRGQDPVLAPGAEIVRDASPGGRQEGAGNQVPAPPAVLFSDSTVAAYVAPVAVQLGEGNSASTVSAAAVSLLVGPEFPRPPAVFPSCPADIYTPLFRTIPIEASDMVAFRPLGFLSPGIHMFSAKHGALAMTWPGLTPVPKPVRAPGRVLAVEIWQASFSTEGSND